MDRMLAAAPVDVVRRLVAGGAVVAIIARCQVTTDIPAHAFMRWAEGVRRQRVQQRAVGTVGEGRGVCTGASHQDSRGDREHRSACVTRQAAGTRTPPRAAWAARRRAPPLAAGRRTCSWRTTSARRAGWEVVWRCCVSRRWSRQMLHVSGEPPRVTQPHTCRLHCPGADAIRCLSFAAGSTPARTFWCMSSGTRVGHVLLGGQALVRLLNTPLWPTW